MAIDTKSRLSLDTPTLTDVLSEVNRFSAEQRAFYQEIHDAAGPSLQPKSVIRKMHQMGQRHAESWRNPANGQQGFDHSGGFKSAADFFARVMRCDNKNWSADPQMKAWTERSQNKTLPSGMSESVLTDGGALVPPTYLNEILMRVYSNDLLSRVRMMPTVSGNELRIPAVDESSRADGSQFGGVSCLWEGEADTITASKPVLQTVDLKVRKLTGAVRLTDELLQDSSGVALESWLTTIFDMVIAWKIGNAIIRGTGALQPLGILNSPSKVSVSKDAGQASTEITVNNLTTMAARLHLSCTDAIWTYNQELLPALSQMTVGSGGSAFPVFLPGGSLANAPYDTILGRPAIKTEFNSTLGTEGDIILWSPGTYLMLTKGGMETAVSMHVYFLSTEQVLRFVIRVDGRSWWKSALTPAQGSTTQSNIITLATRA